MIYHFRIRQNGRIFSIPWSWYNNTCSKGLDSRWECFLACVWEFVCVWVCVCVCVFVCVMGVVDVSVCQHKNGKKFVYRNNEWSKYPLWCCSHGMRLKAYLKLTGYQICFSLFKGFLIETHPYPLQSHLSFPSSPATFSLFYLLS